MKKQGAFTILAVLSLALPAVAAGHTSVATLPDGTPIDVAITAPTEGTEYVVPTDDAAIDVAVSGTASVGEGEPDATLVYVIDVSFSVNEPTLGDCGGDRNGDGAANTILDCEVAGVVALNDAAVAQGSVDEVGVAVYGESGASADMTPVGGDDPISAPDAGPGDVDTVVSSVVSPDCDAGLQQFTPKVVGCGGTNFAAGLAAATAIVGASTNTTNIVVFFSDGESNVGAGAFNANLTALADTGAVVQAVAIGSGSSCTGGSAGTLQQIADATEGTCQLVADPTDLVTVVPDLVGSTLDSIELSVDGGPGVPLPNSEISAPLPQDGSVSVTWGTLAEGLAPGGHTFCASAFGTDAGGTGDSGAACVDVNLLQIDLEPEEAFNELGSPGQTHTVTASIDGAAGTVDGRLVSFSVVAGPNAGAAGTCTSEVDCTTDASGAVSWTYEAVQGPAGIGTDTIRACFSVSSPTGATGCDEVLKHWGDSAAPEARCLEGVNPHGETVPRAGKGVGNGKAGQNPDGFYELTAFDPVDPDPQIFVQDDATGTVFGPYSDGTVVKWTQAPGAEPSVKAIGSSNGAAGAVTVHIIGKGDMEVFSIDDTGNVSEPVTCLVPPPPK